MKLIKLTDENMKTRNGFQWGVGKEYGLPRKSKGTYNLCSGDVFHCYKGINIALLLNPIHARFNPFRIIQVIGEVVAQDFGKIGCVKLTVEKEIKTPAWFKGKKVRCRVQVLFAILCAEKVIHVFEKKYPNDSRPKRAIGAAKEYLNTGNAADAAYAANAANAAYAAADAAYAAADAAYAANAAYAAAYAAYAAANAAYAADAYGSIDFVEIANIAVKQITNQRSKMPV